MIDAIDPLLRLDDDAAVFGDVGGGAVGGVLLALLDGDGALLGVAGVDLEALLVGADVEADAGDGGGHGELGQVGGFGGGVAGAVEDEGVVVAGAAEAAGVDGGGDVFADGLGFREVEEGVVGGGDGADRAVGDFDVVDFDVPRRVRHVQRVVEDRGVGGVGEGVQVPVDVVGEHDRGGGVQGDGHHARRPAGPGRHGVGGVGDDGAGEALVSLVQEGEGDGGFVCGGDGPVPLVVAYGAAVQGIVAHVLILRDV